MSETRIRTVSPPERSWLARWLLPDGVEPDPRFTLANERTYLAWIRTALALIAAGVGLEALPVHFLEDVLRQAISLTLVALATLISGSAYWRWRRIEMALRTRRPLPFPLLVPTLAAAMLPLTLWLLLRVFVR